MAFRRTPGIAPAILLAALLLFPAGGARAFTTRVHIVLANDIVEALRASRDGTIRLRWSDHVVQLPRLDAEAIVAHPLEFRAGAIGPDNLVFPAMTDGTHGVEQDPYRQCELLYQEAFTAQERAYALGCFFHGTTDAIAHHFVNYFTGETFTLNPIERARMSGYENVIGHIVTESLIQDAIYASDPGAFTQSELDHRITQDFVLRTYFDVDSPVWQRLAEHPMRRWRAAQMADPDGNLLTWIGAAGFGPWEHIAMAPQYIAELQRMRTALREWMVARIRELAAHPDVNARPGPDGEIGTPDDETACSARCPREFGEYWVLVRMLAPRFDTRGNPLPSAFDKISDDLGDNLHGFLPALVEVIQALSSDLNSEIRDGADHGLDLDPARFATIFRPIDDWGDRTFAIDWTTVGMAVSPEWYNDLSAFLRMAGVPLRVEDVLRALFEPVVREIRNALLNEVRMRAEMFLGELRREYEGQRGGWRSRVTDRLTASRPPSLDGHALDYVQDSGLLAYAFNVAAVSLANHEVVLVSEDPIANGPTSFDASYTPDWMQIGLCDYLREAVFPYGTGLRALLSVQQGATFFGAAIMENSPVECHNGSLSEFGAPSRMSCRHTTLEALLSNPRGSLSRAYPPEHASGMPGCRYLRVPGLPDPPPQPDAGPVDADGGTSPEVDAGPRGDAASGGGCGCVIAPGAGGSSPAGAGALLCALLALAWIGRRRRLAHAARVAVSAAVVAGCGDGGMGGTDSGRPEVDGFVDMMDVGPTPEEDSGPTPEDGGPDHRSAFLAALDGTVWSARQTRDESGRGPVERAYEMHFRGGAAPMWGEIRNPYGPARQRILRFVRIARDGCESEVRCRLDTTISIPDSSWETPAALRGRMERWTLERIDGSPRAIAIRNEETGIEEVFTEGAWPRPETGLTAEIRVFAGGAGNPVSDAFCTVPRASISNPLMQPVVWEFARGQSTEVTLGYEVAAGVQLAEWNDVDNRFGIRDVDGFQIDDLGGSIRTDQFYFVVRYTGVVSHPGGRFQMREQDDAVEDAVWAFIGDRVGGTRREDLFLEVHHYVWADYTVDEPSVNLGAGDVPIEIIIPRCEMEFTGAGQVRVEMRLGDSAYRMVRDQPVRPILDETLFPPVL